MSGRENRGNLDDKIFECTTPEDFQALFGDQLGALHTLALLLTADEAKAEACFISGLDESLNGNVVFRQWARAWARRAIIRNAIRLLAPFPQPAAAPAALSFLPDGHGSSDQEALIDAVTMLPTFERFAFVISVLEGHSLSDTATMLGCTNSQLAQARARALSQMATLLWHRTSQLPEGAIQPHWYARLESA
jgi:hypothetical protein